MSRARIGVFDDLLVKRKFTGGGSVNADEIIPRIFDAYDALYLPKIRTMQNLANTEAEFVLRNLEKLESDGIKVSKSFKNLLERSTYDKLERMNSKMILKEYSNETINFDLLFDNDFSPSLFPNPLFKGEVIEVSRINKVNVGLVLRGFSCINRTNSIDLIKLILKNEFSELTSVTSIKRYLSFGLHPYYDFYLINSLVNNRNVKFVGLVNNSILSHHPKLDLAKGKIRVLYPSDASRFSSVSQQRKDDYLLFYSRLVPEKGIFEIPLIMKHLSDMNFKIKLKVAGKFPYKEDEAEFFKMVVNLGLRDMIEYLGFLEDAELEGVLAGANVLIYPSHSDTYSITITEALLKKTRVVAYDIRALNNIYGHIPETYFVKEYDTYSFALKVREVAYRKEFDVGPIYSEFSKNHSSYDVVFQKLTDVIDEYI